MKKLLSALMCIVLCIGCMGIFAACKPKTVLKVFAHHGAYGSAFWSEIEKEFESLYKDVDVQVTARADINKNLEATLSSAKTSPDVVYFGTNQAGGFVGTNIIKTKADTLLLDMTDMLQEKIPGEDTKLITKIDPDFLNTKATTPFDDGKTYMLPMFYTNNGIFYNSELLGTQAVPKTYAELAAIVPTNAEAKVFGYPRGGYLDNMNIAAAKSTLSEADFTKWMSNGYSDTMYSDTDNPYKDFFTSLDALKPGFMSDFAYLQTNVLDDVKANTKAFYDGKVAFFVGGSMMSSDPQNWKIKPDAEIDAFNKAKVKFMSFPTVTAEQESYYISMIEQVYPIKTNDAAREKLAKEFTAFLYSDKAVKAVAKNGAMVPVTNRNALAVAAGMNSFAQSLFGVTPGTLSGEQVFATMPTGAKEGSGAWSPAYKQVSCFGINKVMGAGITGNPTAPATGEGLFQEVKKWAKHFNTIA